MATVNVTVLFGGANRQFPNELFAGTVAAYMAPLVYVDSASSLGALPAFPLNTAVVLGAKYLYGADTLHQYRYWECTQAGTTGASHPIPSTSGSGTIWSVGEEVTSGTAKFRIRGYHGWARALTALTANAVPRNTIFTGASNLALNGWAVVMASSHSQSVSAAFQMRLNPAFSGSSSGYANIPGYTLVSVSKATATPTTFLAGASVLGTGNITAMFPSSDTNNVGIARGLTLGHDNTATTASSFTDQYAWSTTVRFYDCKFQTVRQNKADGSTLDYGHTGARHSVRCTYAASHATNPVPAIGVTSADTIIEAPTISRLTTATTPIVRTPDSAANISAGTQPDPDLGFAFVLAADWSGFTGGPAWAADSTAKVDRWGVGFRAYGVRMTASGVALPSPAPLDLAHAMLGTSPINEMHGSFLEMGSHYGWRWEVQQATAASTPTRPPMSRETTIVRTGGGSDAFGAFSYKTEIRNRLHYPYAFEFFNGKTDESFLITLEFQWGSTGTGLTLLTAEDVWLEAAYFNHPTKKSADYVFSFDKYDRRGLIYNDPVGPPPLAVSAAAWGGALSGAVKQNVSVIVTPRQAGPVKVRLGVWMCPWTQNIASTPTTPIVLYVDPLPILSAAP